MRRRWWQARDPGERALLARLAAAVTDRGTPAAASTLLARLLANRGAATPEEAVAFLRARLADDLRPPSLLADAERAAVRLADAVAARERIAIYGDYDADGICAAAQLLLALRFLGTDPLLHVPHRLREGYGLRAEAVQALAAAGARVLVTADCGSNERQEVELAARLGMDVIVCDHHQVPADLPPACALVNPRRTDSSLPFRGLAASGVVFYVLMALRAELRGRGVVRFPDLRRYLDLVALGTVADVMPLRDENRVLVRYGLAEIQRTQRPGMVALRAVAMAERASARAVAFRLAPRLNAAGRLGDAARALELLTTDDPERASLLAAELQRDNEERRAIEQRILAEAVEQVEGVGGWREHRTVVVSAAGWHPGVLGIVAARLVERYERPALVIAVSGKTARGSGRSPGAVDLHAALTECEDLLEKFGGHRHAAGFSLPAAEIARLGERFEAAVQAQVPSGFLTAPLEVDTEVHLEELSPPVLHALRALEPHGAGNPAPALLVRGAVVESCEPAPVRVPAGSPRFVRLRVLQDGTAREVVSFGMDGPMPAGRRRYDLVVSPLYDTWQGEERSRLLLRDLRPASPE